MAQRAISSDSVVEFLHRFEKVAEQENFALVEPMVHESKAEARVWWYWNETSFKSSMSISVAFRRYSKWLHSERRST